MSGLALAVLVRAVSWLAAAATFVLAYRLARCQECRGAGQAGTDAAH